MKTSFRLTLDGLIRALRTRMHQMAEELETGYAAERERRLASRGVGLGENGDDVSNA